MEFREYWKVIKQRLLWIIVLGAVGAAATLAYTWQLRAQYRTTTTLFLNPAAASPLLPYQSTKTVQSVANTYEEFIRTRSFATMVADRSQLPLTAEQIGRMMTTQYIQDTQFFRIIVTDADPYMAQTVANTAADVLIAENSARQQAEQAQIQSQRNQDPEIQQLSDLRNLLQEELKLHNGQIVTLSEQVNAIESRSPSERNNDRLTSLRQELIAEQTARSQTLTSLAQVQASLTANGTTAAQAPDTAVVVDPAPVGVALPRNVIEYSVLALLLSLGMGVAGAFLLSYLDFTVRTPEALDAAYGQQSLGVVAKVAGKQVRGGPSANYQLTVNDPTSAAAESIRALRTSIEVAGLTSPIGSLLITSTGPSEGKTFVAANLAVSFAQYGSRVLLVDLDLRKPTVHSVFGVQREQGFTNLVMSTPTDAATQVRPRLRTIYERASNRDALRQHYLNGNGSGQRGGMSMNQLQQMLREVETDDPEVRTLVSEVRDFLNQRDDIARYLQPSGIENLRLLTCGTIPFNPSELLGSPRAAQVMEQLKEHADIVIFDSPPAATVTDAAIIAPRVDAAIQVVRAGSTRIDLVRRCRQILAQTNVRILGPILNQVERADLGYYSYYYEYSYRDMSGKRQMGKRRV